MAPKPAAAMGALDPELGAALLTCIAVLTLKMALLHALTARARLATEQYAHKQDATHLLGPVLRGAFLAYKGMAIGDVYAFDRLEKNNAENEPFFVLLMLVAGLMKAMPGPMGATICTIYTVSRVLHMLTFMFMPYVGPVPRTLSYLPGLICLFFTSGYVLNGVASTAKNEL